MSLHQTIWQLNLSYGWFESTLLIEQDPEQIVVWLIQPNAIFQKNVASEKATVGFWCLLNIKGIGIHKDSVLICFPSRTRRWLRISSLRSIRCISNTTKSRLKVDKDSTWYINLGLAIKAIMDIVMHLSCFFGCADACLTYHAKGILERTCNSFLGDGGRRLHRISIRLLSMSRPNRIKHIFPKVRLRYSCPECSTMHL